MFEKVDYRMFRGTLQTWDELFSQAAAFASTLRPEELISISHSEDGNDGVVAVWYWADVPHHEEDETSGGPME
jgi:hypothetical protein